MPKVKKYTEHQILVALLQTFKDMNEIMRGGTIKGKRNFADVAQNSWDGKCSFAPEQIIEMTLNNLK